MQPDVTSLHSTQTLACVQVVHSNSLSTCTVDMLCTQTYVCMQPVHVLPSLCNLCMVGLCTSISYALGVCLSPLSSAQASSAVFVVLLFQFWFSMNDMQKKKEPEQVCMCSLLIACGVYCKLCVLCIVCHSLTHGTLSLHNLLTYSPLSLHSFPPIPPLLVAQGDLHELRQQFLQFMKYCETVLRDENAAGTVKETVSALGSTYPSALQ